MNPLTILMKTFDSGVIFPKSLSNFVYIGIILLGKIIWYWSIGVRVILVSVPSATMARFNFSISWHKVSCIAVAKMQLQFTFLLNASATTLAYPGDNESPGHNPRLIPTTASGVDSTHSELKYTWDSYGLTIYEQYWPGDNDAKSWRHESLLPVPNHA